MMNKKDLIILVVLVVLSAISVLNFKVYGKDFDKPVMLSITLSPTYIYISSAIDTVTILKRVYDIYGVTLGGHYRGYCLSPYKNILNSDADYSTWYLVDVDQFNYRGESYNVFNPLIKPSKKKQTFKEIGTAFNCSLNLI